jgi:hypothetical protein
LPLFLIFLLLEFKLILRLLIFSILSSISLTFYFSRYFLNFIYCFAVEFVLFQ